MVIHFLHTVHLTATFNCEEKRNVISDKERRKEIQKIKMLSHMQNNSMTCLMRTKIAVGFKITAITQRNKAGLHKLSLI